MALTNDKLGSTAIAGDSELNRSDCANKKFKMPYFVRLMIWDVTNT